MKISVKPTAKFKIPKDMQKLFNRDEAKDLADDVIKEMKDMIAKGISPIKEKGRFPEYKGVTKTRVAKSQAKTKGEKEAVKKAQKKAYPYSVQSKFPEKKPRPVNLELTGSMLSNLVFKLRHTLKGWMPEVGYFDEESVKKEQGHREGANGQPQRPTIPDQKEDERFAARIEMIFRRHIKNAVDKFLENKKK